MEKVSALVLSYNNEDVMARCLEGLDWADEIIVIDSDSRDRTVAIAEKYGAVVYCYPFVTFGSLRNLALKHARYDWVFSLDTDECMTPEALREIRLLRSEKKYRFSSKAIPWGVVSGLPAAATVSEGKSFV